MSSMIDIVFLLLVFFVMTFKITAMEGIFDVTMPARAVVHASFDATPVTVRLTTDTEGDLAGIRWNGQPVRDLKQLHRQVRDLVDSGVDVSDVDVILDCDYGLDYRHTIAAMDAVSGYRNASGNIVPLIRNVKLGAPRPATRQ